FISGAIVVLIGLSLFAKRLGAALGFVEHEHGHAQGPLGHTHDHGAGEHTHLPPGTDGTPVTWRSLLALGISGGLLPCPSALVVLLSAISLHRVGYGLLLVVAVTTIVSEQRKLWRATLVGALWGVGHTASLVIVGAIVLVLRVAIPAWVSGWLEFGVALMIIMLGVLACVRALRGRGALHLH